MSAYIGTFGLFAFEFRHVANLATRSAILIVITKITRRLLTLVVLTYLATRVAVLIVVAPIALRLFTFVVLADLVAIPAFTILAAKGGARATCTAFALDAVLIAWLAL